MEVDNRLTQFAGFIIGLFLHTIFVVGVSHLGQLFFVDIAGLNYDRAVVFIVISVTAALFDLKFILKSN